MGGLGGWGEVTFQSVDRCTHECYWFLSCQRHLDGPLLATINQSFVHTGSCCTEKAGSDAERRDDSPGSPDGRAHQTGRGHVRIGRRLEKKNRRSFQVERMKFLVQQRLLTVPNMGARPSHDIARRFWSRSVLEPNVCQLSETVNSACSCSKMINTCLLQRNCIASSGYSPPPPLLSSSRRLAH